MDILVARMDANLCGAGLTSWSCLSAERIIDVCLVMKFNMLLLLDNRKGCLQDTYVQDGEQQCYSLSSSIPGRYLSSMSLALSPGLPVPFPGHIRYGTLLFCILWPLFRPQLKFVNNKYNVGAYNFLVQCRLQMKFGIQAYCTICVCIS